MPMGTPLKFGLLMIYLKCYFQNNLKMPESSKLSQLFGKSSLSLQTSLDSAKNRAIINGRFLLISVFDSNSFRCVEQNRDVWSDIQIDSIIRNCLTFLQLKSDSSDGQGLIFR